MFVTENYVNINGQMAGIEGHWGYINQDKLLINKIGDLMRTATLKRFDSEHYYRFKKDLPSVDQYLAYQSINQSVLTEEFGEVKFGERSLEFSVLVEVLGKFYLIFQTLPPDEISIPKRYRFVIYASFPDTRHLNALGLANFIGRNSYGQSPKEIRKVLLLAVRNYLFGISGVDETRFNSLLKIITTENITPIPAKEYDNFAAITGTQATGKLKYDSIFTLIANYKLYRKEVGGSSQWLLLDQYLFQEGGLPPDWVSKYRMDTAIISVTPTGSFERLSI